MIDSRLRRLYQRLCLESVAKRLPSRWPPLAITLLSGFLGCLVPLFLWLQLPLIALLVLLSSGYLDTLDGYLARLRNQVSARGACLDIVCDRLVEAAAIFGLYLMAPATNGPWCLAMLASAYLCVTSFLVVGTLTPNHSEKSFYYSPGLMERAEAFLCFGLMILFPTLFVLLAALFTALTAWTGIWRTVQFVRQAA